MGKKGVIKTDQQKVIRMPQITSIDKLAADVKLRWNQVKLRNTIDEVIMKMDDDEKSSLLLQRQENDDALLCTLGSGNHKIWIKPSLPIFQTGQALARN